MKRLYIILGIVAAVLVALVVLQNDIAFSSVIWQASRQGTWLLPLVFFSSLLDSVHPCSFSILLITIAFLFAAQISRKKILAVGGTYIAGIFAAYFSIGIGLLKVLHLFNTPHFMGKVGSALLIVFGLINLLNYFFPSFPIKLRLPAVFHASMAKLMERTSIIAAFALGLLVGICQFPCMGGPYLMVIGLLRDQVTYMKGFGYLLLYNAILIIPLITVLFIAADKTLVDRVREWRHRETKGANLWVGIAMVIIGVLILFI